MDLFIMTSLLKNCLRRSQLCVMCFVLFYIFIMVYYIYNNFQSNSQLFYQQDQNIKELKTILPQADLRGDNNTVSKLEKVYNETEQKVKLPDKPGDVNEKKISSQRDNNQQKATDQLNQNQTVPGMNATHINGILMEPLNVNYTRNIYFTIKTTHKYYTERLFPIMLTWLQLVDKNKVSYLRRNLLSGVLSLSIITDKSAKKNYVDMFRRAGFQIEINDECWDDTHSRWGLCCKMGTEFAAYYKVVEKHPGEEDRYQWFCHSDDDMYVNIPKLSHLLQQYDPHKPYYVGNFPQAYYKHPYLPYHLNNKTPYLLKHLPLKRRYQYATGSTFCISYVLMMEAKEFMNGAEPFNNISLSERDPRADDMTVGIIIGALLGYNLTDVADITSQLDGYVRRSTLNKLTRYITISSTTTKKAFSLSKFASSLKTPLPSADPTRFLLYHCLLYPTVSWCNSVRETLSTIL